MSWLVRGIIISIILIGIAVLLLFPEITLDKAISTPQDATIQSSITKQPDQTTVPQPIYRTPALVPSPVITTSTLVPEIITQTDTTPTTPSLEQKRSLQLPPQTLRDSDAKVIALISDINPKLEAWVTPVEQIRKWTAFIDRIAQGTLSTKHRPITFKASAFRVVNIEGRIYAAPENYKRFSTFINVLTSVKPDLMARYYLYWLSLFDEAYSELGNGSHFNTPLQLAISTILAVDPFEMELAELIKPSGIIYKYKNIELEKKNDITKWVWRIGPENTKKLQQYLRNFLSHLNQA